MRREENQISFGELADRSELQRFQEEFCRVAEVSVCCIGEKGERLTEISGEEKAAEGLNELFLSGKFNSLLERVAEGTVEEQAVEKTGGEGRTAAVAVRLDGRNVVCWAVYSPSGRSEAIYFDQALDLLRDTCGLLFRAKWDSLHAQAESRRSRYAELEMGRTLRTLEATTEMVQLLDSDGQIEMIMDRLLMILGKHLQVGKCRILQTDTAKEQMEILSGWPEEECSAAGGKNICPVYGFLDTERPLVLSTDSLGTREEREEFQGLGIQAVVVFPVLKQQNAGAMYLYVSHTAAHSWSMTEVKFISDAVKLLQSILTRRIQKNSLASSYEALEAVLDNVGCAIYVKSSVTGRCLFANRRLKNTFARELKENTFEGLIEKGIPVGRGNGAYEINHPERDRWYDLFYTEIAWVDGSRAMLYSLYDITDKKLYQKRIEQQAYTDFLTGLYNRMCCERDLAWHIDEARRNGETGALLYLDLDDFKHINDGLGHQYGDVLLKSISRSLKRVDGIRNTCYRMGGDEFVIIIPPPSYARFERIVEDIRQIFSKPWYLKDADYYCTMSMGIVTFPDGGESVAELIKKADIAMYEAKKGGKNRMARYTDSINSSSGRRLDMEKNMRDATAGGYQEFSVYFQPIIDIQGGMGCAGAEALVRWNSPKLGFISPAEFIPLAEYLGLINPIGAFVLNEACRACRLWNENGHPDYKVNVNLSVVQLLQPDIVEVVEHALEETGVRADHLTLEVTESLAINDMERMKEILNSIKRLGVKIALDDFGTGYSALNHIREIPFDLIKVDQSFVKELAEDAYSQSFIKMVAELAQTIGVSICVEGIESPDQYRVLQDMKVRYIQGYYFDRPMQRVDFEKKYVPALAK